MKKRGDFGSLMGRASNFNGFAKTSEVYAPKCSEDMPEISKKGVRRNFLLTPLFSICLGLTQGYYEPASLRLFLLICGFLHLQMGVLSHYVKEEAGSCVSPTVVKLLAQQWRDIRFQHFLADGASPGQPHLSASVDDVGIGQGLVVEGAQYNLLAVKPDRE